MREEFYAHSREGRPPEEWHRLEDHLKAVAEIARKFANDFKADDWDIGRGYGTIWMMRVIYFGGKAIMKRIERRLAFYE